MRIENKTILYLSLVCFLLIAALAYAYTEKDLVFKDSFERGTIKLPLRGSGLKKFLSFQIAAVGLYVPVNIQAKDILDDIPKSLEVIYLQNIPEVELQHATTKGIRLNVSPQEFKQLSSDIDLLNTYYPSVKKMDRIRVTYIPHRGTIVEVNDVVKGTVPGAALGKAFFSIWLGKKPVDIHIKQKLLGKYL